MLGKKKHRIVTLGDPRLRQKSTPYSADEINGELQTLVEEMFAVMYRDGVGLAGPQIGVNRRIFVIGYRENGENIEREFINPVIEESFGETVPFEEGCLSIPGISAEVLRPDGVAITALDRFGTPFRLRAEGFLARVIQHEFDHLEGKLFIDRVDRETLKYLEPSLKKITRRTRKKLETPAN